MTNLWVPRNTTHLLHPPKLFCFQKTAHSLMFAYSLKELTRGSCSGCYIFIQGFLYLLLLFIFYIFKELFPSLETIFCFVNAFYISIQKIFFLSSLCWWIFCLAMKSLAHHTISICLFFCLIIFYHFLYCLACS